LYTVVSFTRKTRFGKDDFHIDYIYGKIAIKAEIPVNGNSHL